MTKKGLCIYLGVAAGGEAECLYRTNDDDVFEYDSLKIIAVPSEEFDAAASALTPAQLTYSKNRVYGSADCKTDCVLQISLPYSAGWSASVDGQPVQIEQCGKMYMGLQLSAGTHTIELNYETPYLKLGLLLSAAGLCAAIVLLCRRR